MAPAAARTRPAWPAWTSVHALAFHLDDRRHLQCLHHDRGYRQLGGYQERLGHHLAHRHQSQDVSLGPRLRLLGAVRSRRDGPLELDGLRRQDHQDRLDVRQEHLDVRQEHPLLVHLGAECGAHLDVAPGRGCCRPDAGAGRPREAGTGCCRQDADAAGACLKPTQRQRHLHRCLRRLHR